MYLIEHPNYQSVKIDSYDAVIDLLDRLIDKVELYQLTITEYEIDKTAESGRAVVDHWNAEDFYSS